MKLVLGDLNQQKEFNLDIIEIQKKVLSFIDMLVDAKATESTIFIEFENIKYFWNSSEEDFYEEKNSDSVMVAVDDYISMNVNTPQQVSKQVSQQVISTQPDDIITIDLSYTSPTGEWYDGDSIEDGVPYYEGTIYITKTNIINGRKKNKKLPEIEFTKQEQADFVQDIIDAISEELCLVDDRLDLFEADIEENIFCNKLIYTFNNGYITNCKKVGEGIWSDISDFNEDED